MEQHHEQQEGQDHGHQDHVAQQHGEQQEAQTDSDLNSIINEGGEESDSSANDTVVEEELQEDDAEYADPNLGGNYGNQGLFSWADNARILEFSLGYLKAPGNKRGLFNDLVQNWSEDPIDIAKSLYPSGGRLSALNFISEFIQTSNSGDMMGVLKMGASLGEKDTETIRTMVKMLNSLVEDFPKNPEDVYQLRYRRNMSSMEVIDLIVAGLGNLSDDGKAALSWAGDLLEVWPGTYA